MHQYMCKCLNVRIECIDPLSEITPRLSLTDEERDNTFFCNGFSEISLGVNGIHQIIPCLCKTSPVSEWIIHTCLNCNLPTHAVHSSKGLQRVLASRKLINDTKKIEILKQSENYSPAFDMIIRRIRDSEELLSDYNDANPIVHNAIELISSRLASYIKEQNEAMERRIKSFINEQKKIYANQLDKANFDKKALCHVIAKESNCSSDKYLNQATSDLKDVSIDSNILKSKAERSDGLNQKTSIDISNRVRSSNVGRKRSTARHYSVATSELDEDMFQMEGLDDVDHSRDSAPYYNSDDDTDESSLNDESFVHGSQLPEGPSVYATSLPISMTGFQRSRHSSEEEDLTRVPIPVDPKQMAASIKALAQSVKYSDGTEMFGELPSHKMKASDIALSRISTFAKKK